LAKRFKIPTGGVVAVLNLADDLFCQILMKNGHRGCSQPALRSMVAKDQRDSPDVQRHWFFGQGLGRWLC